MTRRVRDPCEMSTFSTGLASQPCTLFSPPSDGSRTLVSTVPGFSEHNIGTSIGKQTVPYTLGTLLRVVQRLLIRRYLPDEIKSSISIAEGETYAVSRGEIDNVLVAVKHVKLDRSDHTISQLSLAKRVQAVLQEISIMLHAELANNRNILGIMGYGWTPTTSLPVPFLVVEYGKHGSLRGWLGASSRQTAPGALDEAQPGHSAKELELKVRICQDIASGLSAIHHAGIVHGDLKLDNIIVTEFSGDPSTIQAKISDFGHSIIVEASAPTPIYYGSTMYVSCESRVSRMLTPTDTTHPRSLCKTNIPSQPIIFTFATIGPTDFSCGKSSSMVRCTLRKSGFAIASMLYLVRRVRRIHLHVVNWEKPMPMRASRAFSTLIKTQ